MAISQYGNEYYGLSGDDKPLGTPLNGRKFTEMDTSKEYRFDAENQQWLQQSSPSGGSTTLSGLTDVDISNPTDGQTLVYNAATGKWENGAGGGVAVVGYSFDLDSARSICDKTAAEINDLFNKHGSVVLSDGHTSFGTVVAYDYADYDPEDFFFNMLVIGANGDVAKFTAASPNDYPYASMSI